MGWTTARRLSSILTVAANQGRSTKKIDSSKKIYLRKLTLPALSASNQPCPFVMSSADNGDWKTQVVSAGQGFAVSGVAAALAHVIHHPLYMLKSQMMYYGPKFSFRSFLEQSARQHVRFLYRGELRVQLDTRAKKIRVHTHTPSPLPLPSPSVSSLSPLQDWSHEQLV